MANPRPAGMTAVMAYFNLKPGEFRAEWAALSDQDKQQLKDGIGALDGDGNAQGALTY